jgi:predicted AlkP superfamily phosphohydrolase/phosphomutase
VRAQVSSANIRFSVLGVVAISFASVICQRIHSGFFARRESAANEELSSGVQPVPTAARPFVLIGLDGGDWRVVLPLIEQGKLPALKSLMDRGTYGYLDCHDRSVSPAVWTSIATGKSFEKHGILGFVAPRSTTGRMTPVKSFDRKVKAIWNILSDAGVRVGVLNWMVTFPAEKVNGFMISRLIQIVNERGGVYPPELEEEIVDLAKRISLKGLDDLDEVARHLQHDLNTLQTLRKLNAELLTRHPVDFYTVYYHGTDEVSHRFFRYAEPERFDPEVWGELEREELDKYSDAVERVWCEADKMLQELIHQCGDWATVMVCSDHGSQPYKAPRTCLRLNHVLEKMGYLSFREGSDTEVDLATSRVYWDQQLLCPEEYRIAINAPVIQDPGKLKTTLIQALRTVRIAETNEPLFGSILDAPERYRGICIRSVPASARQEENLHVTIAGETYPLNNLIRVNDSLSGTHRPTGIFVLSGEGIRRGGVLKRRVFRTPLISFLSPLEKRFPTLKRELRALKMSNPYTTLDVTPTILYLLGFPVAQDMDGRVIGEAIDRRWARSYPLRRIVAYPGPDTDGEFLGEDTYESDDLVLERLRGLGYIE